MVFFWDTWDESNRSLYGDRLNRESAMAGKGLEEMQALLAQIIFNVTKELGMSRTRRSNWFSSPVNKPWFDSACYLAKKNIEIFYKEWIKK